MLTNIRLPVSCLTRYSSPIIVGLLGIVGRCQCFGGIYCRHFQGSKIWYLRTSSYDITEEKISIDVFRAVGT